MELTESWLETILTRHSVENSVAKILSVKQEDVVNKGDNYVSDIVRMKMEVLLGSGKKTERTVIIKTVPGTEHRARLVNNWGVFRMEIKMYQSILPSMLELLVESGDVPEPLWASCFHFTPYYRLIFEDLKALGYRMADKKKALDLEHTKLVVRSLARFHAMSVVLRQRDILDPAEFSKSIFTIDMEMTKTFHNTSFKNLADVIETTWGNHWAEYPNKLRDLVDKSSDILSKLFERKDTDFNVLNHGDCWINNIMIKYLPQTNTPISLRFVDLQLSCWCSYGLDLQYFLTSSVSPEIKTEYLGDILATYQRALKSDLELFGYTGNVPSLEEVTEEFNRLSFVGVVVAATVLVMMLTEPDDVPELEQLCQEIGQEVTSISTKPLYGKEYTHRTKYALKQYFQL